VTEITTSAGGSLFDALRHEDENGEFWWARELVKPLGYTNWRRFEEAIERGAAALLANGEFPEPHIKTLTAPSKSPGPKSMKDYRLTRYGVYAVIQGADPRKPEIAAGWAYFRVRTREAEVRRNTSPAGMLVEMAQQLLSQERWNAEISSWQYGTSIRLSTIEDDIADLKAITPLVGGVGGGALLTIRDAAHAITGRDMGQNTFARWLVEVGIMFRDHSNQLRCRQDWIRRELAQESWEAWQNGSGWSWVTRFTPRGLAKIRQAYDEYDEDTRRALDDED
jgi:hypothetical protein